MHHLRNIDADPRLLLLLQLLLLLCGTHRHWRGLTDRHAVGVLAVLLEKR